MSRRFMAALVAAAFLWGGPLSASPNMPNVVDDFGAVGYAGAGGTPAKIVAGGFITTAGSYSISVWPYTNPFVPSDLHSVFSLSGAGVAQTYGGVTAVQITAGGSYTSAPYITIAGGSYASAVPY
jgi:hypothetical protein